MIRLSHVALAAGAVYLWHEHDKKARKRSAGSSSKRGASSSPSDTGRPEPAPQPRLEVAADCSQWDMSDAWVLQVAQPRFAALLRAQIRREMNGDPTPPEPLALTYALLEGEHPDCPVPRVVTPDGVDLRFDALQAEVEGAVDFYPHAAVLGLYAHVTEAVLDALERFEVSRNPDELLFPL